MYIYIYNTHLEVVGLSDASSAAAAELEVVELKLALWTAGYPCGGFWNKFYTKLLNVKFYTYIIIIII